MAARAIILLLALHIIRGSADPGPTKAGDKFNLYAWGDKMPGLNLFYADGGIFISDYATANQTDNLLPITFQLAQRQVSGPGWDFQAMPDVTAPVINKATRNPPFHNATWWVADRNSTGSLAHSVGLFTDKKADIASQVVYEGFYLIENRIRLLDPPHGVVMALLCAIPTSTTGIWSIAWNITAEDGIPVDLKDNSYPPGRAPPNIAGEKCKTRA